MIAYIVIIAQTIAVMVCIATKAIVIITRMKTIGGVIKMVENKWIVDGHHYICPDCNKTIAVVVNESDEGFDFCPFCGKRMSGQIAENKMAEVARLFGKKLNERFTVRYDNHLFDCKFTECGFVAYGVYDNPYLDFDTFILQDLLTGRAVIVNE